MHSSILEVSHVLLSTCRGPHYNLYYDWGKKKALPHLGELFEGHLNQLSITDAKKLLAEIRASD